MARQVITLASARYSRTSDTDIRWTPAAAINMNTAIAEDTHADTPVVIHYLRLRVLTSDWHLSFQSSFTTSGRIINDQTMFMRLSLPNIKDALPVVFSERYSAFNHRIDFDRNTGPYRAIAAFVNSVLNGADRAVKWELSSAADFTVDPLLVGGAAAKAPLRAFVGSTEYTRAYYGTVEHWRKPS